jgi:two-component system NtrC family sensor kinase
VSQSKPSERETPSALTALADVATYLQAGMGSDDVLSGVVGALSRDLDLDSCCIWVKDREATAFRPIVAAAAKPPDAAQAERVRAWFAEGAIADGGTGLHVRFPLFNEGEPIGLLEATIPEEAHVEVDRRILNIVANILAPWLASIELSEDLAAEVAYRTRETEAQRRFTSKIIDSLPVGLYVVDRDYRIQAWNAKREVGAQGVSRDDVLGREVFDVMSRQPKDLLKEEFDTVFATGEMEQMEIGSSAFGDLRHYRITKIPMRLHDDAITHVITIGEDVTEWRNIQQQISQTEKLAAIGQLAAGVMHEINNPLATIGACSEALTLRLDDLPQPARSGFEEYLRIVSSELDRCQDIVDGLLDFSNPKAQAKSAASITGIVDDALFLVKHHDRFRRIHLVRNAEEGLPPISGNSKQLIQVFLSLMINAIDSMEEEGTLTVTTARNPDRQDEVVVEITDTGEGIKREDLQKIFEPFFTTKAPGRGSGLGLSICYGIVQQHRGRIVVDSQPGRGSTFRVFFPTVDGPVEES